jgi:hypothetical protein
MKCLEDPSDDLIQQIDYGRCAKGTQLLDGSIMKGDSSGDIGLFCQSLLHQLNSEYGDTFFIVTGEEAITIEKDVGLVRAVTSRDQDVR